MSYYDEDFYCEPSEFEQQVDEFKQALMNSVRDDHKAEMERLRKENAELQPIKKRMKEIEMERNHEKRELERVKREAVNEAKKMRLTELLKDYKSVIYAVDSEMIFHPKCGKCDGNRQVEYTTPLGRIAKEDCSCKTYTTTYELREVPAAYIEHYSPEYGIKVNYYDNEREERVSSYHMYKQGTDYEKVTPWTYFADKEEAQKYCDWKAEREAGE